MELIKPINVNIVLAHKQKVINTICNSVITEFNKIVTELNEFATMFELKIPVTIDNFNAQTAKHTDDEINAMLNDLFSNAGWKLAFAHFIFQSENNQTFIEVRVSL